MMQAHFLTFADRRFQVSIDRITRQAGAMDAFTTILGATERDLDPSFRRRFARQLKAGVRGFGYWCWKPQLISQVLARIPDGDVLLYTDAGSHLHPGGRVRLLEYFEATTDGPSILTFELGPFHTIGRWTKGDLLERFGVSLEDPLVNNRLVAAGVLVLRNTEQTRDLVTEWARVFDEWHLVDDTPSVHPNHPEFVEHRHDQSVLSLLARTRPVQIWSHSEQQPRPDADGRLDWSALDTFPIHTRRDLKTDWWHLHLRRWLGLRRRDLRRALAARRSR